jgi:hypothetical protein
VFTTPAGALEEEKDGVRNVVVSRDQKEGKECGCSVKERG